jgi:hypothetical protein
MGYSLETAREKFEESQLQFHDLEPIFNYDLMALGEPLLAE